LATLASWRFLSFESLRGSTTENRGWPYLSHAYAQKGVHTAHGGSVGTAFWLSAY